MRCNTCLAESARVLVIHGEESCHNCRGFSEAGGVPLSGSLTRNSFRIRQQRDHHEGDFVAPHAYNRARHKVDINPDFIEKYPDQAGQYFGDGDMAKAGYKKLPKHVKKLEANKVKEKAEIQADVTYEGNADDGIKRVLS